MFEKVFKNIDKILRDDAGCSTELDYAEQSSWALFLKWLDDYEKDKEQLSKRILNVVQKHVGGLRENIDYQELSTPLTVRDLANYTRGEMYGIDHSPERFRQRWLRPQSSIKNLYFVGQDITTVGVSSALFSGLLTASAVLGKNLSKLLRN